MLENKQCPLSDVIHAHNVYICIMYVFTSTWTCHMVYTYRITSFTVTCRLNIVKCGGVSGSTDNHTQNVSNQAHAEREKYLKTVKVDITANPLTFWEANKNDFPTLSELARNYLGTPATSATSEREFKVGKLITKERIRLLPKNVESLLFLKYNLRALKYNIDLPRAPVHFKPPNSIQYDELEFQEESNLE